MKKLLLAYSLLPLVLVITIMSFIYAGTEPHGIAAKCIYYVGGFYAYYGIGFILWAALLIFMRVTKRISNVEMILNIAIVVVAVLLVYLVVFPSLNYVSGIK
ncbi:MAG TPA: hypothetical protein VNY36_07840 [Bacteroidia bacterium]|jgi:hypothetical protein|nr:hypothetical protein [Bacteroidia bacterium]